MTSDPSSAPGEDEPLARPVGDCIRTVFPTPVAVHDWPESAELNLALASAILALEAADPDAARPSAEGWRSGPTFLNGEDAATRRLMGRIRRLLGEMTGAMMDRGRHTLTVEGRAIVLRHGQYRRPALCPGAAWTGLYLVTANPPPEAGRDAAMSGLVEILDPRPAAAAGRAAEGVMHRRVLVDPEPGTMLAIPGWLEHMIHPHFGPAPRIAVAFTASLS